VSKSTNRPIIWRVQSQKKLREIKLEKLFIETKKKTIWVFIKAYKEEKEIIFEEKRQRYLNASLRSQQSPWLIEIKQLRDYKRFFFRFFKKINDLLHEI